LRDHDRRNFRRCRRREHDKQQIVVAVVDVLGQHNVVRGVVVAVNDRVRRGKELSVAARTGQQHVGPHHHGGAARVGAKGQGGKLQTGQREFHKRSVVGGVLLLLLLLLVTMIVPNGGSRSERDDRRRNA